MQTALELIGIWLLLNLCILIDAWWIARRMVNRLEWM
jgi:hypothetical protein